MFAVLRSTKYDPRRIWRTFLADILRYLYKDNSKRKVTDISSNDGCCISGKDTYFSLFYRLWRPTRRISNEQRPAPTKHECDLSSPSSLITLIFIHGAMLLFAWLRTNKLSSPRCRNSYSDIYVQLLIYPSPSDGYNP
jgi:hypothetical protein